MGVLCFGKLSMTKRTTVLTSTVNRNAYFASHTLLTLHKDSSSSTMPSRVLRGRGQQWPITVFFVIYSGECNYESTARTETNTGYFVVQSISYEVMLKLSCTAGADKNVLGLNAPGFPEVQLRWSWKTCFLVEVDWVSDLYSTIWIVTALLLLHRVKSRFQNSF